MITCVDGVGAFDHVLRSRMFAELLAHPVLQVLVPHVRLWCGSKSKYIWTDANGHPHEVEQGEGGEQGDPLMPALFCLAVQSALTAAQGELLEAAAVFAYLDELYLLTTPDRCAEVLSIISWHLQEKCGISVNQGKLQSWCPRGGPSPAGLLPFSTPEHTVWRSDLPAEDNGVVVVGTPIGHDSFVSKVAEEKGCEQDSSWSKSAPFRFRRRRGSSCCSARSPGLTICCAPSRQARL